MLAPIDPHKCLCGCERDGDCRRGSRLRAERSRTFLFFDADLFEYIMNFEAQHLGGDLRDGMWQNNAPEPMRRRLAVYCRMTKLMQVCKTLHNRYSAKAFVYRMLRIIEAHAIPESGWYQGTPVGVQPSLPTKEEDYEDFVHGLRDRATLTAEYVEYYEPVEGRNRPSKVEKALAYIDHVVVTTHLTRLERTTRLQRMHAAAGSTRQERDEVGLKVFEQINRYVHWDISFDTANIHGAHMNATICTRNQTNWINVSLWSQFPLIDPFDLKSMKATQDRGWNGHCLRMEVVPHGPPNVRQHVDMLWIPCCMGVTFCFGLKGGNGVAWLDGSLRLGHDLRAQLDRLSIHEFDIHATFDVVTKAAIQWTSIKYEYPKPKKKLQGVRVFLPPDSDEDDE